MFVDAAETFASMLPPAAEVRRVEVPASAPPPVVKVPAPKPERPIEEVLTAAIDRLGDRLEAKLDAAKPRQPAVEQVQHPAPKQPDPFLMADKSGKWWHNVDEQELKRFVAQKNAEIDAAAQAQKPVVRYVQPAPRPYAFPVYQYTSPGVMSGCPNGQCSRR